MDFFTFQMPDLNSFDTMKVTQSTKIYTIAREKYCFMTFTKTQKELLFHLKTFPKT